MGVTRWCGDRGESLGSRGVSSSQVGRYWLGRYQWLGTLGRHLQHGARGQVSHGVAAVEWLPKLEPQVMSVVVTDMYLTVYFPDRSLDMNPRR